MRWLSHSRRPAINPGGTGSGRRGLAVFLTSQATFELAESNSATLELKPLSANVARSFLRRLLRSITISGALLTRIARECRGVPLRLRRTAHVLHERYGTLGSVPDDPGLPSSISRSSIDLDLEVLSDERPAELEILRVLAEFQGVAEDRQLLAASNLSRTKATRTLERLIEAETVRFAQEDKRRTYLLKMCRQTGGDIHALTQALGVKRAGLYRRFQRIGLDVKKMRDGL